MYLYMPVGLSHGSYFAVLCFNKPIFSSFKVSLFLQQYCVSISSVNATFLFRFANKQQHVKNIRTLNHTVYSLRYESDLYTFVCLVVDCNQLNTPFSIPPKAFSRAIVWFVFHYYYYYYCTLYMADYVDVHIKDTF